MNNFYRWSLVCGVLFLASCIGSQLAARLDVVNDLNKRSRKNGAYKCAPRELALSESHAVFASEELDQGNPRRAEEELAFAEKNAQEAIDKSPAGQCNPALEIREGDRDGDGILDADDACPDQPEDFDDFKDEDGCPELDNDNDGILDVRDECTNEPEDRDGFEDEDGCPDLNNDGDKLLDVEDKCPDQPADTEDGCPKKYKLIVVTKEKIELKQTVYFEFNKATIRPKSFALLTEVGAALREHPKISVRIEGHTDSRGADKYNLDLSQRRAESVKQYITETGIGATRMVPKGFGETMPIADNRTQRGRSQNRRVEFVITSR